MGFVRSQEEASSSSARPPSSASDGSSDAAAADRVGRRRRGGGVGGAASAAQINVGAGESAVDGRATSPTSRALRAMASMPRKCPVRKMPLQISSAIMGTPRAVAAAHSACAVHALSDENLAKCCSASSTIATHDAVPRSCGANAASISRAEALGVR